jgi:hypothetical protein
MFKEKNTKKRIVVQEYSKEKSTLDPDEEFDFQDDETMKMMVKILRMISKLMLFSRDINRCTNRKK